MKILLLANHFNTGGISTYLLTLVKGYAARGHEVFLATSGGDCVEAAKSEGARHFLVPSLRVKCEFHPGLWRAAAHVAEFVRANGIDILHAQTRVTQSVAAMAGLWSARPYVATCHGFFRPHLGRLLFPLWGDGVIAISFAVARHLSRDLRAAPSRITVVVHGVDTVQFMPLEDAPRAVLRARFGIADTTPVVGIIARLSDVKGHCYLIEAVNELSNRIPGIKCLIIGEGPLEGVLKEHVARLKLQSTVVFMPVSGRPSELLPLLDAFALPSLQEGLGLSAMEAQACGIPVVGSRVGGLVEVVKDGETGILVPPRDHLALSEALFKVLSDRDFSRRMGQAARSWIERCFSIDEMVDRTLDVYRKIAVARE